MSNVAQKAILTAKINGVLKDLMVKTNAEQVMIDDTTTLAAKLADVATALDGKAAASHIHAQADVTGLEDALTARPTTDAMNSAISAAISDLIGGAPETYDTLKEIADYIETHQEVVDALNAAIGNKADKSTVETLQALVDGIKSTVDGLGALATKDTVSESDLDAELQQKIGNIAVNAGMLTELTEAVTETRALANSKSTVHYSATQPENLAEGDIWVQLVD